MVFLVQTGRSYLFTRHPEFPYLLFDCNLYDFLITFLRLFFRWPFYWLDFVEHMTVSLFQTKWILDYELDIQRAQITLDMPWYNLEKYKVFNHYSPSQVNTYYHIVYKGLYICSKNDIYSRQLWHMCPIPDCLYYLLSVSERWRNGKRKTDKSHIVQLGQLKVILKCGQKMRCFPKACLWQVSIVRKLAAGSC